MTRPAWIPAWIPTWALVLTLIYVGWKVFVHIVAAILRILLPRS